MIASEQARLTVSSKLRGGLVLRLVIVLSTAAKHSVHDEDGLLPGASRIDI